MSHHHAPNLSAYLVSINAKMVIALIQVISAMELPSAQMDQMNATAMK